MSLSASLIELRKDAGERKGHAFPWTSQITLSAYGVDPKVLKNSQLFSNILRRTHRLASSFSLMCLPEAPVRPETADREPPPTPPPRMAVRPSWSIGRFFYPLNNYLERN